jgi:hypothetical protein
MTKQFWRLPVREKRALVGFAIHYGTKRTNIDTGIREMGRGQYRFTFAGVEYSQERKAINAWKAQQGGK